jgi:hypothetical protein
MGGEGKGRGGQLSGEDVITGFTCPVDELFLDI